MSTHPWSNHPSYYRENEIQQLNATLNAGECVSLIGLSGMGKSNLLGFFAYRSTTLDSESPECVLIDCNRLHEISQRAFFQLSTSRLRSYLEPDEIDSIGGEFDGFDQLEEMVSSLTARSPRTLALLLDGFDDLASMLDRPFFNLLRALRDTHKYRLTYLLATRHPLQELAEAEKIREFDDLFVANQLWLNPLAENDARWTLRRFEERHNCSLDDNSSDALMALSGRHPGLLVALASAWPQGDPKKPTTWLNHPRVMRECELLWGDLPELLRSAAYDSPITDDTLHEAGVAKDGNLFSPVFESFVRNLQGTELNLNPSTGEIFRGGVRLDVTLTPKEHELLTYLLDHQNVICEKDDLIRAVWTEDKVFEQGVRDDSLAQLVRRLRVKIEPDPSTPSFLLTIPGRGYRLIQPE
jgi:DNA-binding winged helix-turn-helix (wHTH) protein